VDPERRLLDLSSALPDALKQRADQERMRRERINLREVWFKVLTRAAWQYLSTGHPHAIYRQKSKLAAPQLSDPPTWIQDAVGVLASVQPFGVPPMTGGVPAPA
jgi:hypothetical protein